MLFRYLFLLFMVLVLSASSSFAGRTAGFKKEGQTGSLVRYSGSVILEGKYLYSRSQDDQEMIGDKVCFYPSHKDAGLIPRENDKRAPWFCFNDTKRAKEVLLLSMLLNDPKVCSVEGSATLEISNYVVDRAETNTNDTADLVRVIDLSKPATKQFTKSDAECK